MAFKRTRAGSFDFICLSADTKTRTEVETGALLYEIDTGKTYIFDGLNWQEGGIGTVITSALDRAGLIPHTLTLEKPETGVTVTVKLVERDGDAVDKGYPADFKAIRIGDVLEITAADVTAGKIPVVTINGAEAELTYDDDSSTYDCLYNVTGDTVITVTLEDEPEEPPEP